MNGEPLGQGVARLAERQHGVVSVWQLRNLGLTDEMIEGRARAGTLHPVFWGSYAVGHRKTGRRGVMLAAVLSCGEGAVVSHRSAAELLGLWDKKAMLIDITSPRWAGRAIQGVRWHRVRYPGEDEVTAVDGIPSTNPSRTLVDLAGSFGDYALRGFVEQAAILRVLDVPQIDRILARGRRRGAPRLRAALDAWRGDADITPDVRTRLETRLLTALVEGGLPRPQCNRKMKLEGRRIEVDFFWEEQRLAIETDGEETHGTRVAFQRDRERDQRLVAAGFRTARITWRQVEKEPGLVVDRIRRMLQTPPP
jgi:very-short-patch-repair endonuclease